MRGWRGLSKTLGAALLLVIGLYGVIVLFIKALDRLKGFRDRVRLFTKRTLNPTTLKTAGQKGNAYSVVHHVGRCSGTVYATPVSAAQISDGFVIPLPYGKNVDWCRNILAAGQGSLTYDGTCYKVDLPEVIEGQAALALVPSQHGWVWRALGMRRTPFLRVKVQANEQMITLLAPANGTSARVLAGK